MDALRALEALGTQNGKRPAQEDAAAAGKRARTDVYAEQARNTRDEVARRLAAADARGADDDALDETSMKRLVLSFEKRVTENMKMRAKFAAEPHRFLNAEIELYADLKKLHALATSPALLPAFVETQALATILALLSHENLDISIEVVDLLSELTDGDLLTELHDLAAADALVDALLGASGLEMVVGHMARLDEKAREESEAVHKSLLILENLLDARPQRVAELLVDKTALLGWLLQRLKPRAFDANKLYASEVLAILLQGSARAQAALGGADGIEALLLAVAPFKRKDPAGSEEAELAENLFDCLCAALLLPSNQTPFLKAEGVELMILTLRESRVCSRSALKTLDFALQRNAVVCERFVDSRGLGALFPFLGGQAALPVGGAKSRAEREAAERESDAHLVALLCSLCHELSGAYRQRLLGKFVEGGFEKARRLVGIRAVYAERVRAVEARFGRRTARDGDGGDDDDDDDDEARYLGRLDAGLLTVQLATTVLAYLVVSGDPALSKEVLLLLHESGVSLPAVVASVGELRDSMGDEEREGSVVTNNRRKMDALCAQLDALCARLVRRPVPSAPP